MGRLVLEHLGADGFKGRGRGAGREGVIVGQGDDFGCDEDGELAFEGAKAAEAAKALVQPGGAGEFCGGAGGLAAGQGAVEGEEGPEIGGVGVFLGDEAGEGGEIGGITGAGGIGGGGSQEMGAVRTLALGEGAQGRENAPPLRHGEGDFLGKVGGELGILGEISVPVPTWGKGERGELCHGGITTLLKDFWGLFQVPCGVEDGGAGGQGGGFAPEDAGAQGDGVKAGGCGLGSLLGGEPALATNEEADVARGGGLFQHLAQGEGGLLIEEEGAGEGGELPESLFQGDLGMDGGDEPPAALLGSGEGDFLITFPFLGGGFGVGAGDAEAGEHRGDGKGPKLHAFLDDPFQLVALGAALVEMEAEGGLATAGGLGQQFQGHLLGGQGEDTGLVIGALAVAEGEPVAGAQAQNLGDMAGVLALDEGMTGVNGLREKSGQSGIHLLSVEWWGMGHFGKGGLGKGLAGGGGIYLLRGRLETAGGKRWRE